MSFLKQALKAIYELIPFKKNIFLFVKKFWSPPENIYKHLHFKGVIDIPISLEKKFKIRHYGFQVENEIFWAGLTGNWEKESLGLWINLCKNSSVIFDIGANTGIYSLIAKCQNPASKVYAFEPVKRVFEKLQQNVSLNNFEINCYELAVSNFNGKAVIYDTITEHTYSVTVNQNLNPAGTHTETFEISTITLDTIIEQENLSKIDLMKIDVETHEFEVIEGYSKYIKRDEPTILIEILNDQVGKRVENLLHKLGCKYLYFNIDENNGIRQVDRILKSDYFNFLLCSEEKAKFLKLV